MLCGFFLSQKKKIDKMMKNIACIFPLSGVAMTTWLNDICVLSVAIEIVSGMGLAGSGEIADEASGELELLYSDLDAYHDRAVYTSGTVHVICSLLVNISWNIMNSHYFPIYLPWIATSLMATPLGMTAMDSTLTFVL